MACLRQGFGGQGFGLARLRQGFGGQAKITKLTPVWNDCLPEKADLH